MGTINVQHAHTHTHAHDLGVADRGDGENFVLKVKFN